MANSGVLLAGLLLVSIALSASQAKAAVSCGDVVRDLSPCISYVSSGGTLTQQCCDGVKTLYSAAQTSADRQNVCKCIKSAVNGVPYSAFNLRLASELPSKCGVNIPYKISPSTDCNSVK